MTAEDYQKLLDGMNKMILHYGIDICGQSLFRLTTLNTDGSNYFNTTLEQEIEVCNRKEQEQRL